MNSYKVLNKQIYKIDGFSLVPIRFEDRYDIMKWRNEQIYHLRQKTPLTETDQDNYFNNVVSKLFEQEFPNQLLFSFLKNDKCIGYGGLVHIHWKEKSAEVSFIMNTSLEENKFDTHWTNYLKLVKKIAFDQLNFENIFTYAYDLRPILYPTLEKNNFKLKEHLKDEIEIDGIKTDVFIHECSNPFY
jgi:RimJ/RimL family protein N-acetyltransferase